MLLLDAPSAGLAVGILRKLTDIIARIRQGGASLLVAEQNLDMARALATRCVVLAAGRMVWQGPLSAAADIDEIRLPAMADAHSHARGLHHLAFGARDPRFELWRVALCAHPPVDPYLNALLAFGRMAQVGIGTVMHVYSSILVERLLPAAEAIARAVRARWATATTRRCWRATTPPTRRRSAAPDATTSGNLPSTCPGARGRGAHRRAGGVAAGERMRALRPVMARSQATLETFYAAGGHARTRATPAVCEMELLAYTDRRA